MVLTLIQQGLGLRPRKKRALCGKMWELSTGVSQAEQTPDINRKQGHTSDL